MSAAVVVRGPILNPRPDGRVDYFPDGVLAGDERGKIVAVGDWNECSPQLGPAARSARAALGWIVPPFLDAHIHIPQHPIRGRFLEGVHGSPPEGTLLAGLNRNVFPAEGRCADRSLAQHVVEDFRRDTLAHGVVGGAAYMTVHAQATAAALAGLPDPWSVGLVLMQRSCPEYLRTDEPNLERDTIQLAGDFGPRVIMTDRFAGAVDTPLRLRGVELARRFNLRMQTHLNEQIAEKAWIESLYPDAAGYTDVYRRDGLLDRAAIVAHAVRMRPEEFDMLAAASAHGAAVAHCPVSNTLLGSGVMPLDELVARKIPYALCTDVGASPTTSLLCEMVQFLRVHRGRSRFATPAEALLCVTLAPAQILGMADRLGSFEPGKECSFVEVAGPAPNQVPPDADGAILRGLLEVSDDDLARFDAGGKLRPLLDQLVDRGLPAGEALHTLTADVEQTARRLNDKIQRVTLAGSPVWPE
ncbi:MAG: amidohydrolase family protein [Pirellulales bacterium]